MSRQCHCKHVPQIDISVVSGWLHVQLGELLINIDEKHSFAATLKQSWLDIK